jgi:hypothetical protein
MCWTEAICHEQLLPDKKLSWNFSEKFKLLGITFNLSESEKNTGKFYCKCSINENNIKLVVL